ncbi:sensor histidine kinase [Bacillus massiliigorillae]|uniref:sensor histidine kinase n=1 Tax=Bacillus massiliigorillae TaxID=1243664 RepID=UPI0003AAFE2F|nr:sensor histidine kinase [Bacillus massiliigorillae]
MIKRLIALVRQKNNGISPYIWTILCILPFYFILQSSSTVAIIIGILLTVIFFICYRFAFIAKGWSIYVWTLLLIGISVTATISFSYVYFAFFIAYFVGRIHKLITFRVLYFIQLIAISISIYIAFMQKDALFVHQIPFVVITWLCTLLLPFSIRSRNERGRLEMKLEDANKKIAELVKLEERARIARDLHDTLGQKLSLIGLKSDLARRLISSNPDQAKAELKDVQQTARTALNEVRTMVSSMRGIRLKDEIIRIQQILDAAQIHLTREGEFKLSKVTLLTENILSMCLKEAVTNVVKHSGASNCYISIEQSWKEIVLTIRDDGEFKDLSAFFEKGHGLRGMKERLEFVNGSLDVHLKEGTAIIIRVPNNGKQTDKEDLS